MSTIEEQYKKLHPKSAELYQRAVKVFPNGVTHDVRHLSPFPIYVTHAQGGRKWDVDGNGYVDYFMGHGALLLGHSHPAIVTALQEQAAKGTHYGASHELEVRWAERVTQLMPSAQKVRFHSSGTEATLMALRLARGYTGKSKIIKFQSHFHGWHDYAVKASSGTQRGIPNQTWDTMVVLPPNDIGLVEKTLNKDKDIAAVILEPTGANFGSLPIPPSFLHQLREVTKKYGVLLIFDEVVTGFRISPGGVQGRYGIIPDLTTMAKVLAGGMPGGAVGGRAEIMELLEFKADPEWNSKKRIAHQGTFNASPMSAAAGSVALNLVATQPINARADANAKRLKEGLNNLLAKMEIPGCVSGVASIVDVKIGKPCDCDKEVCTMAYDDIRYCHRPEFVTPLRRALINEGMDATRGSLLLVSAAHTDKDIDDTINALEKGLNAMRNENLV